MPCTLCRIKSDYTYPFTLSRPNVAREGQPRVGHAGRYGIGKRRG